MPAGLRPGRQRRASRPGGRPAGLGLAPRARNGRHAVPAAAAPPARDRAMTGPGRRPAIAVALHDGFCSFGTGAGSANRAFLTALTQVIARGVRLAVLPVGLVPGSTEYNRAWHAEMRALIDTAGGEVFPVRNRTPAH